MRRWMWPRCHTLSVWVLPSMHSGLAPAREGAP